MPKTTTPMPEATQELRVDQELRTCNRCGAQQPTEEFPVRKRAQDGSVTHRFLQCHPCRAAMAREWRAANPEAMARANRKYFTSHREQCAQSDRLRRLKNLEQHREADKAKRARKREYNLEWWKNYYHNHADYVAVRQVLAREMEWAKVQFPQGYTIILHPYGWRSCPLGQFKPRGQEAVIAEVRPHQDGHGWKVTPWPVVDASNKKWLQAIRRRVARER